MLLLCLSMSISLYLRAEVNGLGFSRSIPLTFTGLEMLPSGKLKKNSVSLTWFRHTENATKNYNYY